MTPEAQRIAIAEAYGWRKYNDPYLSFENGKEIQWWIFSEYGPQRTTETLPDYLDIALNKMRKNIVPDLSICIVAEHIDKLMEQRAELLAACKFFMGALKDGDLVRDLSNDSKPEWAGKMMKFVASLQTAQLAIDQAEERTQ